jgi:hypothetical protein
MKRSAVHHMAVLTEHTVIDQSLIKILSKITEIQTIPRLDRLPAATVSLVVGGTPRPSFRGTVRSTFLLVCTRQGSGRAP